MRPEKWLLTAVAFVLMFSGCAHTGGAGSITFEQEWMVENNIKTLTYTFYIFSREDGGLKRKFSDKYSMSFDRGGNGTVLTTYKTEDEIQSRMSSVYKFHLNGKPEEGVSYEDGKFVSRTVYKYDYRGNVIERVSYDADGKIEGRGVFVYDEAGNEIESLLHSKDGIFEGREVSVYDEAGNEIESLSYANDGELTDRQVKKYDRRGRLVEVVFHLDSEEGSPHVTLYKYRVFSNVVEIMDYDLKENFSKGESRKYVYKYNRDGSTDEIITFWSEEPSRLKYEYEYNKRGNTVLENAYSIRKDEKVPLSQTFYEYTYWDE